MAKRSNFKKSKRDFYATPPEALLPLLPHLKPKTRFVEPTAGRAHFILGLEAHGHKCVEAYDLKPLKNTWKGVIQKRDILEGTWKPRRKHDVIATNPPFTRKVMHRMITMFSDISPTWMLLEMDWLATKQSRQFKNRMVKVVVIGRIKWFPKSKSTGMENYVFVMFDKPKKSRKSYQFFGPMDEAIEEAA